MGPIESGVKEDAARRRTRSGPKSLRPRHHIALVKLDLRRSVRHLFTQTDMSE